MDWIDSLNYVSDIYQKGENWEKLVRKKIVNKNCMFCKHAPSRVQSLLTNVWWCNVVYRLYTKIRFVI